MSEQELRQLYCLLEKAADQNKLEIGIHTILDNGELGDAVSVSSPSTTISASFEDGSILISLLQNDYAHLGNLL